jgi:hypothetical protein
MQEKCGKIYSMNRFLEADFSFYNAFDYCNDFHFFIVYQLLIPQFMKQFFKELFEGLETATEGVIGKLIVHFSSSMLIALLKTNPRKYMNGRPVLKERFDLLIFKFFWRIYRRIMIYFFPPALMFLVWIDPKLDPIDTPTTYLILCGLGFLLGKLFDWAKSDLDKRIA